MEKLVLTIGGCECMQEFSIKFEKDSLTEQEKSILIDLLYKSTTVMDVYIEEQE